MRVLIRLPGVRDLWHVYKLHERQSRLSLAGLLSSPADSPFGEGQGRNPGVYTSEKSERQIIADLGCLISPNFITLMQGSMTKLEPFNKDGYLFYSLLPNKSSYLANLFQCHAPYAIAVFKMLEKGLSYILLGIFSIWICNSPMDSHHFFDFGLILGWN